MSTINEVARLQAALLTHLAGFIRRFIRESPFQRTGRDKYKEDLPRLAGYHALLKAYSQAKTMKIDCIYVH